MWLFLFVPHSFFYLCACDSQPQHPRAGQDAIKFAQLRTPAGPLVFVTRPSYLRAGRRVCSPSRWCTLPCRAAVRTGASPPRSAAGSGGPCCRFRCKRRTHAPRRARTSSSSRSPAPSPAGSRAAPADTWTSPCRHRARTERKSPSIRTAPEEMSRGGKNSGTWLSLLHFRDLKMRRGGGKGARSKEHNARVR